MRGLRGRLAVCCALLLIVACCSADEQSSGAAAAGDSKQTALLTLNTDSFSATIEQQTAPALVAFVVQDRCDGCKQILPQLEKAAANLQGIAAVGTVDCNTVAAVRTCRAYNAHSFPKILVFRPGTKVNPYTGGSMKDFSDFEGPVSAKALITAVTETLDTSHLTQLATSPQHEALLQQDPQLSKVLLFSDKPASTVLAKGLSWAYARRLLFAEVRPSSEDGKALAEQYGVDTYPKILVVKADGGGHEVYSGSLKAPKLRTFLDTWARPEPLPVDGSSPDAAAAAGVRDPLGQLATVTVHSLGPGNLTDIHSKHDMWLIAFYATQEGESCVSQLQELTKLLVEVQGLVSYGTFNTTGVESSVLEPFKLDTAALAQPGCSMQLVLLPYGDDKQSRGYSKWDGGLGDAKALQEWLLDKVPDFTSSIGSEGEAQAFLDASASDLPKQPPAASAEERAAPIAKVLLFTTKAEAPGIYKALAMQFAGKARLLFAWATADANEGPSYPLMQKMNVRKAPAMTILFPLPPKPLGADNDEVPNTPRDNMAMQQYMGPLKYQKMLAWLTAMSTLTGMSYKVHAGATQGPAPQDFEIRTQEQLQSACYDKPGLCIITLLDGRADTANQHRDTVKQAASAHAGQPVNWVVVDAAQQPSFRRAYGFSADQLPALLALSTKRMRFAQGAAPFGQDSAKQLVTKVLMGTAVTLPLPALPQLVAGGEAEEAELAVQEEEFNLDEVMAEDVNDLLSKEERLKQADEELQREEQAKKKAKTTKKKSSKKKSKKKKAKQKQQSSSAPSKDEL